MENSSSFYFDLIQPNYKFMIFFFKWFDYERKKAKLNILRYIFAFLLSTYKNCQSFDQNKHLYMHQVCFFFPFVFLLEAFIRTERLPSASRQSYGHASKKLNRLQAKEVQRRFRVKCEVLPLF
jgi:hypothetical protein